jgi:Flp pilus assembly protein TadG
MSMTRKTISARIARWQRDASGVAGIEMAFVLPLLLVMFFGLVDFGNALSASRRVATTTNIVADLITQQSGGSISKAELQSLFSAARSTFAPFDSTDLAVEVIGYTRNNNTVSEAWRSDNGARCASPPPVDMTRLGQLSADGNDVVVARVCYTVSPIVGMVMKKDIELKDQLMLRPRYSLKLACKDC